MTQPAVDWTLPDPVDVVLIGVPPAVMASSNVSVDALTT